MCAYKGILEAEMRRLREQGGADLGSETQDQGADAPGTGAAEGDGSPAETEEGRGGAKCGSETEDQGAEVMREEEKIMAYEAGMAACRGHWDVDEMMMRYY